MLSLTYEITTALSHTDELISPPYDIAIVTISYGRVTKSPVWDTMMSKKYGVALLRRRSNLFMKHASDIYSLEGFGCHSVRISFSMYYNKRSHVALWKRVETTSMEYDSSRYLVERNYFRLKSYERKITGNIWVLCKGDIKAKHQEKNHLHHIKLAH